MSGRRVAVAAFVATLPWIIAVIGWAAHWNAYLNLILTLGGGVLWIALFIAAREENER